MRYKKCPGSFSYWCQSVFICGFLIPLYVWFLIFSLKFFDKIVEDLNRPLIRFLFPKLL